MRLSRALCLRVYCLMPIFCPIKFGVPALRQGLAGHDNPIQVRWFGGEQGLGPVFGDDLGVEQLPEPAEEIDPRVRDRFPVLQLAVHPRDEGIGMLHAPGGHPAAGEGRNLAS